MSEGMVIRHCSPTLAGMKTASMFSCSFGEISELRNFIRHLNRVLVKKGLRVLPLRAENNRALIYVYRPHRLKCDLAHETSLRLLQERAYNPDSSELCIRRLIERIRECDEFPHEIGLFLGYPPEDVQGFIDNKAMNFKCIGTWKVYGDAEKAEKTFQRYKKCTSVYCAQYANGRSIERLTVAE